MNKLSESLTPNLFRELLSKGFVKLPALKNYINLDKVFNEIASEVGDRTFTELTPAHSKFIDDLGLRDEFAECLHKVAQVEFGFRGDVNNQYHVARFVTPGHSQECYRSHFDSHIFTLVLPISIPHEKEDLTSGELLYSAKARRYPKSEVENIITKTYFKRYASEEAVKKLLRDKLLSAEKFINLEPLLFLGMTTLHTNAPVASTALKPRLTCLAHYFDPSPKFGIGNILRTIRNR